MDEPRSSCMKVRAAGGSNGLTGALWLAKMEVERVWFSYLLTGLLLLFLGFFVVPSLSGVFELRGVGQGGQKVEDLYNALFADCLFLAICAFLAVNLVSGNRPLGQRDAFSKRLVFLRGLPIPAKSLVGSCALCTLFALVLNVPAFFLPAYFLSDLGQLGTSYPWFAGIWIGYGLLASGLYLLFELTANGKAYGPISIGLAVSLLLVLAYVEWRVDFSLVGATVRLTQSYGALAAFISILAGAAAFALLYWATVHRINEGDLSRDLAA